MSVDVKIQRKTMPGVELSDRAKAHVLSYLSKRTNARGLRLSVSKTGCSGLAYVVDYVDEKSEFDMSFPFEQNFEIFIDKKSYPYLKGLKVDYVRQGLNHKFVFENPNQTGQCGCGESFTIE